MIVFLIGIVLLGMSYYIKGQVEEGKEKISSAQKHVDTTNTLFSLSPTTKDLGKNFTGGAQNKINKGNEDVQHYEALAGRLRIGGYIALVLGAVIVILGRKKRAH